MRKRVATWMVLVLFMKINGDGTLALFEQSTYRITFLMSGLMSYTLKWTIVKNDEGPWSTKCNSTDFAEGGWSFDNCLDLSFRQHLLPWNSSWFLLLTKLTILCQLQELHETSKKRAIISIYFITNKCLNSADIEQFLPCVTYMN